jgi:hypothetical protein
MMRTALFLALAALAAPGVALAGEREDPRCAMYGGGFIYSETSGFCIKVRGSVETGYQFGSKRSRGFDTEAGVSLDARKDTEAGPLRLFIAPKGQIDRSAP